MPSARPELAKTHLLVPEGGLQDCDSFDLVSASRSQTLLSGQGVERRGEGPVQREGGLAQGEGTTPPSLDDRAGILKALLEQTLSNLRRRRPEELSLLRYDVCVRARSEEGGFVGVQSGCVWGRAHVCLSVCVCTRACVPAISPAFHCVHPCVCVFERERERASEREREREREREGGRERARARVCVLACIRAEDTHFTSRLPLLSPLPFIRSFTHLCLLRPSSPRALHSPSTPFSFPLPPPSRAPSFSSPPPRCP